MSSKMRQEIHDAYNVSLRFIDMDRSRFERCRSTLKATKQLILMGTGASLNACRAGQFAFMKYAGILPHVVPASDIELLDPCLNGDSLVVLVSQSGQSFETHAAVEFLKKRGVTVWGITNQDQSVLAAEADETFLMHAGEEVSSATKTYVATLLLLFSMAAGDDEQFQRGLERIPAIVRQTVRECEEKVASWSAVLEPVNKIYLLGAGAFAVTAQQGALVLKEKTFQHAEGMSISEFRHGNIEVVQAGLPVIISAAAGALEESLKHAEYLASLSAEVYLITDRSVQSALIPPERIVELPELPDPVMAQIVAVLPLMQLAERIAALKGHDIDGFRYIAKVVDRY